MAISVKSVTISPNVVTVGGSFTITITAEDVSWNTIKNDFQDWQEVKSTLTNWKAVQNYT